MGIGAISRLDQNSGCVHLIGVVTALRAEASCIVSARIPFNESVRINAHSVVWLSGMGASAAQRAAKELCQHGVTALVSFGVAGALDPSLKPGDLVLPDAIYADQQWPVNLVWRDRLQQKLAMDVTVVNGVLASSAEPLTDEKTKQALAQATGACAVDMESAAIAAVAATARIPFIAVRAIIDPVQFSPPQALLSAVYPDGSVNPVRIMTLLLNRSVHFSTLIQMGAGMRAARKTLSRVIQLAGSGMASQIPD